ncbi:winged helix-turn-helix transcriptional regulator [Shimia biformata]|uniref:winged helix-turn-helix transcriptional regulator n=1 Tax=Shimia biformata TaxID=1294299 RepID=UPI00194EEFA5|nr:helix-turn-helix domain-containing protein [Shimia biformata]
MIPKFSVLRAIRVVGDAWVLRILHEAFRGTTRFSDWQANLGIPPTVLSNRLDSLVACGILGKTGTGRRNEYVLDEAGLDLWEVLLAIRSWEISTQPGKDHVRPFLTHLTCGETCEPVLCCSSCTGTLTPFNTFAQKGPGAGFEAKSTTQSRRRGAAALRQETELSINTETLLCLGDSWTPAIIATAFRGFHRFSEFESYLGIPPLLLSERLKELVSMGVLTRKMKDGSEGVRLTQKGLALFPYISMLAKWGDTWLDDGSGVPLTFHHHDCGCQYTPVFRCSKCNGRLHRRQIKLA